MFTVRFTKLLTNDFWDAVVVQTQLKLLLFLLLCLCVYAEFPRVIYRVAKSYSRQASKVTSTANSHKAAQK